MCTLNITKTTKCQPDAGDRPDLIQTEPVPSIGLARNKNKNQLNKKQKIKKSNYQSHVQPSDLADSLPVANLLSASRDTLSQECTSPVSLSVASKNIEDSVQYPDGKWLTDIVTKTTKVSACCQAHTGNGPHPCGVGVGVPDDGLTRPKYKNKRNEKKKNRKSNYLSHVTLVEEDNSKKPSQANNKTTKVSACCQAHTGNGPHPCGVGAGVPDDGLTRPKSNYLSDVSLADVVKTMKSAQVTNKTTKVSACCQAHTGNGPHPCGVGAGVPDDGLARQKSNYYSDVSLLNEVNYRKLTQVSNKTTKVSACCQAHTGNEPHPCGVGAGVPDDGLARQKSNYYSDVTMVKPVKHTKWVKLGRKSGVLCQLLPSFNTFLVLLLVSQHCIKKLPPIIHRQITNHNNHNGSELKSDSVNNLNDLEHHMYNNRINAKMVTELQYSAWRVAEYNLSHKMNNKLVKMRNGNHLNQLRIVHWNLGSKLWNNKLNEIEMVLAEKKPDLFFVSEANLWQDLPESERCIPGHKLILPKTMTSLKHSRLVLIVKDTIEVKVLNDYMDDKIPSIWCKIGGKKTGITVGGFYREFTQLGTEQMNDNAQIKLQKQEQRWKRWMDQWKLASRAANCYVVGDLNLDHLRWGSPDSSQENMIDAVKNDIETAGFIQLIRDYTRSMSNQADSCLDHVWTNSSHKVSRHFNNIKGESDHNLIGVDIATGNIRLGGQNIRKRNWKNFDVEAFKKAVEQTDWSDIFESENVELANSEFEDRMRTILDSLCPMKVVQLRAKYNSWIADSTKVTMAQRDEARKSARITGNPADWKKFRILRNKCTDLQKKDKNQSLRKIYDGIEEERDSGKLFSTTKSLLGWNRAAAPTSFLVDGRTYNSQLEVANIQARYYTDKIEKIKNSLPRVNLDPHLYLRRALSEMEARGNQTQFLSEVYQP